MAGRIAYYGGIVKDGLVLNLDAAKIDSYPRTGTTWRDISGNQINGTLVNGPTFNPNNGGSIVFDGVNDNILISNFKNKYDFSTPFTLSVIFNPKVIVRGDLISTFNLGLTDGVYLEMGVDASIRFVYNRLGTPVFDLNIPLNLLIDKIHNIVAVYNGVNSLIYFNGVLQSPIASASTFFSIVNQDLYLGMLTNTFRHFNGNIYQTLIYNRALSAQEVLQNYNATKGRYGL